MCGIAGLFVHDKLLPDLERLEHMARVMVYRGPDDEGIFQVEHIGLVHRRLSIRDLTTAGHCPMGSPDGRFHVVFNGEIYNWRELRSELEHAGISFSSQSDTEVIVQGYRYWGEQLLSRLRGMFAFAVWDGVSRKLFLARDRAGEKPIFYQQTSDGLAFASSIEALRWSQTLNGIDGVAIACHLGHNFIPSSHTVWSDVNVLPPAHSLVIEPGKPPVLQRYWDFPYSSTKRRSLRECERDIEDILDDSVSRCLDADVPVGVLLSGGVDSSLIAALAARHSPGLPAFSLGFAESSHSELPYASKVAEHLGLEHHTIQITEEDVMASLPHLVRQYGQPFGDSSCVPSYCVASLARRHVKVCLGGDGGDEAFGGYWRMQSGVYAMRYAACFPPGVRKHVIPVLAGRLGTAGRRLQAMNQLSLGPPGAAYTNSQSWYEILGEIAGPTLRPVVNEGISALRTGCGLARKDASVLQRILYDDFQVQLPDAYLTKVDVASMAASLEVRSPYLDQRVLESAWLLPDSAKLNWGRRKWLLKRIASRHVPPEVIHRPKMGFAMPLSRWFGGRLGEMLEEMLRDSIAVQEGWIRLSPVTRCMEQHRLGRDHSTRLWLILWLELWFRTVYKVV